MPAQLPQVMLRRTTDGGLEVLNSHHRLRAAVEAALEQIPGRSSSAMAAPRG